MAGTRDQGYQGVRPCGGGPAKIGGYEGGVIPFISAQMEGGMSKGGGPAASKAGGGTKGAAGSAITGGRGT